jgi:glycosidase
MDYNQIFYQIYPLGFTGAPKENDGIQAHRIRKVLDFIPHYKKLGITAIWFSPVFESDRHGYDTRDYRKIDCRLGTNEDFQEVCDALHDAGIKVVLDGVFNHVGRGFWAFKDVQEKKWESPYSEWFYINYNDTWARDGFTYQNWEGHDELVKLNLQNPEVRKYLLDAVDSWIADYNIDGLRLDVAYMVDRDFLRELKAHTSGIDPDFMLLGEMIGGDYNVLLKDCGLHSVTNYECRKGIYSSLNSHNMFEIAYSLNRQFGNDPWTLYHGQHLLSFVDNHDVDRIASVLEDPKDLKLAYALIYGMPGMPCIYYGSEWGAKGKRTNWSDAPLRPAFDKPKWTELTDYIAAMSQMRKDYPILADGDYTQLQVKNEQLIFRRRDEKGQLIFALNCSDQPVRMDFNAEAGDGIELVTKKHVDYGGGLEIAPKDAMFIYTPKQ